MHAIDILQPHFKDGAFDQYIIQMFIESNNTFNYTFFNKFYETTFTHGDINNAILELQGTKAVKFIEAPMTGNVIDTIKLEYKFGLYPNVRQWIDFFFTFHDTIIPRSVLFNWVSKQHPKKVVSSFLPTNDRNHYHDNYEKNGTQPS